MKITKITAYQAKIVTARGGYAVSRGRVVREVDNTVILVETDSGVTGVGESCPMGTDYLPAFPGGVRAGLDLVAPVVLGRDPREISNIYYEMDKELLGHPYVKTAIDMACWDILGKSAGAPLYKLFGGMLNHGPRARIGLSAGPAEEMARMLGERQAQGYNHFSAKVGDDPDEDIARLGEITAVLKQGQTIVADANRGWTVHGALRVCQGISHVHNVYIEQPCDTYEECLLVRRAAPQPMILDECIDTIPSFMRAWNDKAMDCVNIKTARHGGISKTLQLRDLCTPLGIAVYIQDVWGSSISASAIAHLAASTPPELFLGIWDPIGWNESDVATGGPEMREGRYYASERPGRGGEPMMDVLGVPVAEYA
ncbi:MAG: mandelate racemase/muconate lactonizing enzyme family protein [Neomegalonema sp.]